ncbi:hypothetical protein EJ05DRAFT_541485 [Pseudovirgaria hyperparasitica]|uniref:Formin GTPase-binding domain-containing protein n=1 Tax=Pseudovirgaria hyperparasitica TaxID=470096 RepID=A0A6A6VXE3_9PEZI|nr:uncharacterized protein EJ05DRAFT_541485 [Pseudovirgaria hyperparasitica]KAF2753921.1 hypothetical protein EJ05DRAFT_541485 [Pseudovirgaria hyperparasitica]
MLTVELYRNPLYESPTSLRAKYIYAARAFVYLIVAMATPASSPEKSGHRRNRSTTVLKSIMSSRSPHKRAPSDGTALFKSAKSEHTHGSSTSQPILAPPLNIQQAASARVLGEISNPAGSRSTSKQQARASTTQGSPSKKAQGSMRLRSFVRDKEPKDTPPHFIKDVSKQPKKTKSSTGISNMFGIGKSRGDVHPIPIEPKDKENTTPPNSANGIAETPIWSQFRSQSYQTAPNASAVALSDRHVAEEEIVKYTPTDYSPSKQINFQASARPTLQSRSTSAPRPKSEHLPHDSSMSSLLDSMQRKISGERERIPHARVPVERYKQEPMGKFSSSGFVGPSQKKGGRVKAAVAAYNVKSRDVQGEPSMDPDTIAIEFEAVLESRNVPDVVRSRMRTLADRVKIDFIMKHKTESSGPTRASPSGSAEMMGSLPNCSDVSSTGRSTNSQKLDDEKHRNGSDVSPSKKGRPRSRTFTFNKGDSPTKKPKSEETNATKSDKPHTIAKSPSSRSLSSVTSVKSSSSSKSTKTAVPEDFVNYLRKTTKPQEVEVGKLHKLRLLLRNETVAWVDSFISQGGMGDVVGLIDRILELEWREEHEDALLHETLLCLKGLCTTSLALHKLCEYESKLFPTLLKMLFDEERKGPSEFTTREIVIRVLFTHLCAARGSDLPGRARTILGYLQDPAPPEEAKPLAFILEMHQPRPYRIWCREIVNVTKEVFWIFLHHLNVIPLPSNAAMEEPSIRSEGSSSAPLSRPYSYPLMTSGPKQDYTMVHFPQPRPPVPAAPYIGGVEWDATQYLATHMDLLNGIIASIPTVTERNKLRAELRASGFEKVMGGALRTCKEKFYGHIHDVLREWILAAIDDGWDAKAVRMGETGQISPTKSVKGGSPMKKKEPPPKIETLPQLGFGVDEDRKRRSTSVVDEWLGV